MKNKTPDIIEKSRQIALDFFNEQNEFKKTKAKYEELKTKFYSEMSSLFEDKNVADSITFVDNCVEGSLEVKKIQKSSVVFNADKLEKVLDKNTLKDVIIKKYEIVDMFGLTTYLKECNVDPNIFKSFISVTKSVDVKELERLEETGKLTTKQLDGCYIIKKQNPYFTVGIKKWRGEND